MHVVHTPPRLVIARSLLIYLPFLGVIIVVLIFLAREVASEGVSAGRLVGLALVGFIGLLLLYQVVQSARDLFARPVETTGLVERRWSRSEFFLFRNDYIFLKGTVFRLPPEIAIHVDLGDAVRIVHYPHTGTVASLEVLPHLAKEEQAQDVRH